MNNALALALANLAAAKAESRAAWNAYNAHALTRIGDHQAQADRVRAAAAAEAAAQAAATQAAKA